MTEPQTDQWEERPDHTAFVLKLRIFEARAALKISDEGRRMLRSALDLARELAGREPFLADIQLEVSRRLGYSREEASAFKKIGQSAFTTALHEFMKELRHLSLSEHVSAPGANRILDDFNRAFPVLQEVRDAMAHYDERARGLVRGEPIENLSGHREVGVRYDDAYVTLSAKGQQVAQAIRADEIKKLEELFRLFCDLCLDRENGAILLKDL